MAKKNKYCVGIVVGGGPAPGINGVISAATIEAIKQGWSVIGIMDGFQWLARGGKVPIMRLKINDVSRVHLQGGSILRTSRENPTTDRKKMAQVVKSLDKLGVNRLVTIGGDDTAYTASRVEKEARGRIKVAHVPKTIDNDLPLPNYLSTFGYQTARHVGVGIVKSLMEDSATTNRWYFVVTMGRKAGHLALGIGKAAGVTLTIIPEEFSRSKTTLTRIADILEGAIIKRLAMGKRHGVAVLAEGLGERLSGADGNLVKNVEKDAHGHIRLAEIDLGKFLKDEVKQRLKTRNLDITVVDKNIGYELRCAAPIPFDNEYTRDLGYGVIKFLQKGGSGALITLFSKRITPLYFSDIINPKTGRTRIRTVDINTESYEVARHYMIRLEPKDFNDSKQLKKLIRVSRLSRQEFLKKFAHLRVSEKD
ncbi:MAG: 6-phosphofructokinase [Planctomycetes bacterium]|nr:6-phosphofructokinase [Planctomycetota bacterium]